jgi:hypothetical protein
MAARHSKSWMPIGNLLDDSVTGVARAVEGELVVITGNNSVGGGFTQVPRHSLSSTHMPLCGMHEVLGEEQVCGYCYFCLHDCAGNDNAPTMLLYRECNSGSLHGPSCLGLVAWAGWCGETWGCCTRVHGYLVQLELGELSNEIYDRADRVTVVSVRSMSMP